MVADGEEAQVMAKNKLARREILALFGLTRKIQAGIRKQRENNLSGKWTVDRGRLKIFTRFLPTTLADI